MEKLKLVGSKTLFDAGIEKEFVVYYYIQISDNSETYGVRLEKKYLNDEKEFEYAEETGITTSSMFAEELTNFLIDYDVTPVSLPESLDTFLNKKE